MLRRVAVYQVVFLRSVRRLLVRDSVVLVQRFLSPWWRRRYVLPKHRFIQESHGLTCQKTPFFNWCTISISMILKKDDIFWMSLRYATCEECYYLIVHLRLHSDTNIHRASWRFEVTLRILRWISSSASVEIARNACTAYPLRHDGIHRWNYLKRLIYLSSNLHNWWRWRQW
jgi:hypothetical protein